MMEERGDLEGAAATTPSDGHVRRAIEQLYRREYTAMVRLAFTLVRSDAVAEEIVQDAFVEVHQRFEAIHEPGGYLRTAVVSRCRTSLRRQQMADRIRPEPPEALSESAAELWDVLEHLSEVQRTVVILRHLAGYRASEIAPLLELPAATVRSHDRRALAALRKELEP